MNKGLGQYLDKGFYPSSDYQAIHEVKSWAKVRGILRSLLEGKDVPPVVVYKDTYALNGTHRLAANELASYMGHSVRVSVVDAEDRDDSERLIELFENGDFDDLDRILDQAPGNDNNLEPL